VIYLLFHLLFHAVWGFKLEINWASTHLLDKTYLQDHPLKALLYLHGQPPAFNALTIFLLKLGSITNVSVDVLADIAFTLIGYITISLGFEVCYILTGSLFASMIVAVWVLFDPAFALFQHTFFYEFTLPPLVLAAVYAASKLRRASPGWWILFIGALSGLVLFKALFHPIFAILLFLTAVAVLRSYGEFNRAEKSRIVLAFVGLVLSIGIWPLKNYVVFGSPVYSSWQGFNLSYRFPIELKGGLASFITNGTVPDEIQKQTDQFKGISPSDDLRVVRDRLKQAGGVNWNNLIFIQTLPAQMHETMEWRKENPKKWLTISLAQYFMAMRGTFMFPYSLRIWRTGNDLYEAWATFYHRHLFLDIRPLVEKLFPDLSLHKEANIRGFKAPYPFFAFVFPFLLVLSAISLFTLQKSQESRMIVSLALLLVLWTICIPSLTDGAEANRMRFSVSPLLAILIANLLHQYLWCIGRSLRFNTGVTTSPS
jgi:hypothetical protein